MDLYKLLYWIVIETYPFSNRNSNSNHFSNRNLPSFFTFISFIASREELYIANYKNNNEPKKTLIPRSETTLCEDIRGGKNHSRWYRKFNFSTIKK